MVQLSFGLQWSLVLFLLVLSKTGETSPEECLTVPEASKDPDVEVCVRQDTYEFHIGDFQRVFSKKEFETRLAAATLDWLKKNQLENIDLEQVTAQLWMNIPELNPEAAQPRLFIKTNKGNLLFWFDLRTDDWQFQDAETSVLGKEKYPDSFGYRPKTVLIQTKPNVSDKQLERALRNEGATLELKEEANQYRASTEVFKEELLSDRLLKRHSDIIKTSQVNSVMEWIARRLFAFSFKMKFTEGNNLSESIEQK